jgi:4-amino-4-deoxy-L-arabinose transferase-like glycosyltransferase
MKTDIFSTIHQRFNSNSEKFPNYFYTVLAILTFFFIVTGQVFWSTIHGDGAVYAWLIREVGELGIISSKMPNWSSSQIFAEHPYLFFYFSTLFTNFFGYSDLAVKIPNFVVAGLTLFSVYKICQIRNGNKIESYQIGLISCYVLAFNATFMMQVSQPSLDPMAQLISIIAIAVYVFSGKAFVSSLILGAAFLTKGLEMLPHLASFFFLAIYFHHKNLSKLFKTLCLMFLGVLIPIVIWLAFDRIYWNSQWLSTYWLRQFTSRFFKKENMETAFNLGFLITLIKIYWVEGLIIIVGLLKSKYWIRRKDSLFVYFVLYTFFTTLAFLIIKKDSSQHLTGVVLLGSIFVGEYLWELWQRLGWKYLQAIPFLLFILGLCYWNWFVVIQKNNPDVWTTIKSQSQIYSKNTTQVPIIVKEDVVDNYGVFYTTQWYSYPRKVYFHWEASQFNGRNVVLVVNSENNGVKFLETGL